MHHIDGNMVSLNSSLNTKNLMRRRIVTFEKRSIVSERNRQCAFIHGCLGSENPSDRYLRWILWLIVQRKKRSPFAYGTFCMWREQPKPWPCIVTCRAKLSSSWVMQCCLPWKTIKPSKGYFKCHRGPSAIPCPGEFQTTAR